MATIERELQTDISSLMADKAEIRRVVEEQYQKMGLVFNPAATAERAQQMVGDCLRAHGIKPEDNIFSRGIIAARDEE